MRTLEASLASAVNDRDSLQAKTCLLEKTIDDLEMKLSDEGTGRRLAEQSVGSLRLQLEDMRNDKVTVWSKINDLFKIGPTCKHLAIKAMLK